MQNRISFEYTGLSGFNALLGLGRLALPTYSLVEATMAIRESIITGMFTRFTLDQFDDALAESLRKAEDVIQSWSTRPSNLEANHIGAIALYTSSSLSIMQSIDKVDNIRPFLKYIWLLLHALKYLPELPDDNKPLYRAIHNDFRSTLIQGSTLIWPSFTSVTTNLKSQAESCELDASHGDVTSSITISTLFIIHLTSRRGRNIQLCSLSPENNNNNNNINSHSNSNSHSNIKDMEVLLPPNSRFVVKSISETPLNDGKTITVQLYELPPEEPLLSYGLLADPEILRLLRVLDIMKMPSNALSFLNDMHRMSNGYLCIGLLSSLLRMVSSQDYHHEVWYELMKPTVGPVLCHQLALLIRDKCFLTSVHLKTMPGLGSNHSSRQSSRSSSPCPPSSTPNASTIIIPTPTQTETTQGLVIAELGFSLFRQLCRRSTHAGDAVAGGRGGGRGGISDYQPILVGMLLEAQVVELVIAMLQQSMGPGNSNIIMHCFGLLHYVISDSSASASIRRMISSLHGCELILSGLNEHGFFHKDVANHGLFCIHYLRADTQNIILWGSKTTETIENLLDQYTAPFYRAGPYKEEVIYQDFSDGRNIIPFLLWQRLSNTMVIEQLYNDILWCNKSIDREQLSKRADIGIHIAESFLTVSYLLLSQPKNRVVISNSNKTSSLLTQRLYASRCWAWLNDSVSLGMNAADFCRAMLLIEGVDGVVEVNVIEGIHLLRAVAMRGYALGQYFLGVCYATNRGVLQNDVEAMYWFHKAADQGHASAFFSIGEFFHTGRGICSAPDVTESIRWYRRAADMGHIDAEYALGTCFDASSGEQCDHKEAQHWYRRAAEHGHLDAQMSVARCYEMEEEFVHAAYWYYRAANQGDKEAEYIVSLYLSTGCGGIKDPVEAFLWVRKAAEHGHISAMFKLATCYAKGRGVISNDIEAVYWYSQAAELGGHLEAKYKLAVCYSKGIGVAAINDTLAGYWYQEAANEGYVKAQYMLGMCYANGLGVIKDESKALEWYHKAAAQGLADAQFQLAECYLLGIGVNIDITYAVEWYRHAAEQGHCDAQFKLAIVSTDDDEGVTWYRRAAEQGDAIAQFNLGARYAAGRGIEKNECEAVSWYRKSADQGYVNGQFQLAACFEYGRGVHKDEMQAVAWYLTAATSGHIDSQYKVGRCYERGRGVTQDMVNAVKWYRLAADNDHPAAQYHMGLCCLKGEGTLRNKMEAREWFSRAAKQGHDNASVAMNSL